MITDKLEKFIEDRIKEFEEIPEQRKKTLEKIAHYVCTKIESDQPARLTFICTHNSRRSHLAQVWAQTAAHYFGIPNINTFSGGTEATSFHPNAVKALSDAGFLISPAENGANPKYVVKFADNVPAMQVYSKVFDERENPTQDFVAIMTCSHADENCPFIPGASLRIPVTYDDPKDFDGTSRQEEAYRERNQQIAREMFYLFHKI